MSLLAIIGTAAGIIIAIPVIFFAVIGFQVIWALKDGLY